MNLHTNDLSKELLFLRAKATKYAFYGVIIASLSVALATLLVSYVVTGEISLDGIMQGQSSNIALWVLDTMPFLFAAWGQFASYKMANEANLMLKDKTRDLYTELTKITSTSKARSDFFSKISHELRTPLNGVVGMVDLLLETELNREQRRYAGIIKSSADGLLNLINDLLDFSKIEAGKLVLEEIVFDLRECIEGSVALLDQQARRKGLRLSTAIEPDMTGKLIGDPGRLRQVIVNLVSNAIKFTERGEVALRVCAIKETADAVEVRIEVADTGIGISEAAQSRLFQPYSQVDASTSRKYGGTGLGLAISKELVEAMGGDIGVKSAEKTGSTFWFTVCLHKPAPAGRPEPAAKIALSGARVLLADANPATRLTTAERLRSLGMHVEEVSDGVAALQMLLVAINAGYYFDLVITDMFLPHMSGEELGREIKARPETRDIVLIMMTAVGQRGDAQHINQLGFAAYLGKPLSTEQLPEILAAALATRDMDEDQRRQRGLITKYTFNEKKSSLHILLAEDSAVNREIIQNVLTKLGCTTDTVTDGEQAIVAVGKTHYDLILMDLHMPGMDGLTAVAKIRELPHSSGKVPIVALTAGLSEQDRHDFRAQGVNDILLKPLDPAKLKEVMRRLAKYQDPVKPFDATQQLRPTQVIEPWADKEVIHLFLNEAKQRLEALREGLNRGDALCVAREAHTLKSTSAYFHAATMQASAAELEQLANGEDLTHARPVFKLLEQAYETLQAKLKKQLRTNACA